MRAKNAFPLLSKERSFARVARLLAGAGPWKAAQWRRRAGGAVAGAGIIRASAACAARSGLTAARRGSRQTMRWSSAGGMNGGGRGSG